MYDIYATVNFIECLYSVKVTIDIMLNNVIFITEPTTHGLTGGTWNSIQATSSINNIGQILIISIGSVVTVV